MSRGPGRWQRAILAALADFEVVPIVDLVHLEVVSPTRGDHVHARRAARTLAMTGRVRAVYLWQCVACHKTLTGWPYRCCGRLTPVLVVTKDASVRCVQVGRMPAWISGASGPRC